MGSQEVVYILLTIVRDLLKENFRVINLLDKTGAVSYLQPFKFLKNNLQTPRINSSTCL